MVSREQGKYDFVMAYFQNKQYRPCMFGRYIFCCTQVIAGGHIGPDECDESTSSTLLYRKQRYSTHKPVHVHYPKRINEDSFLFSVANIMLKLTFNFVVEAYQINLRRKYPQCGMSPNQMWFFFSALSCGFFFPPRSDL